MPILPAEILENIHATNNSGMSLTFRNWLNLVLKLLLGAGSSEKRSGNTSQKTPQQDIISQSGNFAGTPKENESSNGHVVSEVGYNFNIGDKWVLNIKHLNDKSQTEPENLIDMWTSDLMEVPIRKFEWISYMASEIRKVSSNARNNLKMEHWDCAMVCKTLAYTIYSLEASLRYSRKSIFSGLTPREEACLENLIRISYALSVNKKPLSLRLSANLCALKLLDMIVKNGEDSRCVLEWNCFGVLVGLLVAGPNIVSSTLVPSMASVDNFLMRLMLISRIAQVLITLDLGKYRAGSTVKLGSEAECILFLLSVLGHRIVPCDPDELWKDVKQSVRPFLRCCSIFFHYKQPEKFPTVIELSENDTFENLASFLQLPTSCSELLGDDLTIDLFMTWAEHPKVRDFHIESASIWKFEPYIKEIGTNRINTLIKLPQDYSELLSKVRDFSCSSLSEIDDSQNPTMCLICGKILCSLSYCCQTELYQEKVGACTFHAHECGAGVGIFLQIRECQLVVLAGLGRGCYKTPPYLDEHHEPDQGLRRGNKLLLCEESYRQLELSWINHGLYDMVTRTIEMGGSGLGRWLLF